MSFQVTKLELAKRVRQALGQEPADLVVKDVSLLNVVTGDIRKTDIAITGNTIVGTYDTYHGRTEIDGTGLTAVPGFIDTHDHVESSMVTPLEFDRMVLPRGTTTAVWDPHEIANVLGVPALLYAQESSEQTLMDLMVQLSSCVPATLLETSGARLDAGILQQLRDHPSNIGLAEFMDIGGVLGQSDRAMDKLEAFGDGHIDGHLPNIKGYALNAMLACGILTDHESTRLPEAMEKLSKGVRVLVREGTICKDLGLLWPLITERHAASVSFCTDDRNPLEIEHEGHIDHMIRKAIKLGVEAKDAYRVASFSAAQAFGLDRDTPHWQKRGLIAPGFKADIVLLNDLATCAIHSVMKNGAVITDQSFSERQEIAPVGYNSVKIREIVPGDFMITAKDGATRQDVIGIIPGMLLTEHLTMSLPEKDGALIADPANDLLKIAVIERHGHYGNIAVGFVKGFGFDKGAIASSVGHDSHNITVVGSNDDDMALAVNVIRENQGGYAVVKDGKVVGSIALPIAGLMSDKPYEAVCAELQALRDASHQIGSKLPDPLMMLAFLPLGVIPELKLHDLGLVRFGQQGPELLSDQRGDRPNALAL